MHFYAPTWILVLGGVLLTGRGILYLLGAERMIRNMSRNGPGHTAGLSVGLIWVAGAVMVVIGVVALVVLVQRMVGAA